MVGCRIAWLDSIKEDLVLNVLRLSKSNGRLPFYEGAHGNSYWHHASRNLRIGPETVIECEDNENEIIERRWWQIRRLYPKT